MTAKYRLHVLDGGVLAFDRATGHNVLLHNERTKALVRQAPRSLQIGLLTPCNLRCGFCYRDTEAPSLLSYDFIVDLARRAADWGVLELAFGGGEPFLFKRFPELVETIHRETPLGLNVTTNGMLLDRDVADRLRGKLSEIRLSIYDDNDWRASLERLRGHQVGANWLVTPANVGRVVPQVLELLQRGAKNVLLLGYKGDDPSLRLDAAGFELLRRSLRSLVAARLPVRVDVCWYPDLADEVPFLFARSDCGAGDESLMITPDKKVQACSFAKGRVPFETFEDLQEIYASMRATRPHAETGGCTRERFPDDDNNNNNDDDDDDDEKEAVEVSGRILPTTKPSLYAWQAWASSNSGPYLLLARFRTPAEAEAIRAEIEQLYEQFLEFANSDDFAEWSDTNYYEATPQMKEWAKARGFTWPKEDGFAWEEVEEGGLEIRAVGSTLLMHHPYAQNIGENAIGTYASRKGADLILHSGEAFRIRASATTPRAQTMLDRAVTELADEDDEMSDYVEVVNEPSESASQTPSFFFEITNRDNKPSRFVLFTENIGGQNSAADFLMLLGEIQDVVVELRDKEEEEEDEEEEEEDEEEEDEEEEDEDEEEGPTYLEDGEKFWEASLREKGEGWQLLTRFGKIDQKGQTRLKSFETKEAAQKELESAVTEKQKQGFAKPKS